MSNKGNKLTSKQADQLREQWKSVREQHTKDSIELAKAVYESAVTMVLVEKKTNDCQYCWKLWGYSSWEAFLGAEMGLHLGTAYTLKRVYEVFYLELAGKWNPKLLLPISKMKLLASQQLNLTEKNVEDWLTRAAKMTPGKLRARIFNTEETVKVQLSVRPSQRDQLNRALDEAASAFSNGENMNRGDLLAEIIADWRRRNKTQLRAVKQKAA